MLRHAQSLYALLEYDQVVPIAQEVLRRPDATAQQQLDANLLEGSSLAVVGDGVEAERPFRFLLRGRPDFDMPPQTSPKILAVFRKVQMEERAIQVQLHEIERQRAVGTLQLSAESPHQASGGHPVVFNYHLRDPQGIVSSLNVLYRRSGERAYSSLALQRHDAGTWSGEIGGEWTASRTGFNVEYYVSTSDDKGQALLSIGEAAQPLTLKMSPGELKIAQPFYKTVWFWSVVGVAVAATAVTTGVWYEEASRVPQGDLRSVPIR